MSKTGRPTIMTPETLNKLEEVFALGGSDKEACFYAGISHQTLYNYQENNPDFVERKEALKETPVLKARRTVVKSLEDPNSAWKMLERKDPDLHPKQQIDHTTKGEKIENSDRIKELALLLNNAKRNETNSTSQTENEPLP